MLNNFLSKKLKILHSSDDPILLEFRQLVVNIVVKELMVFCTYTVSKSNENVEKLDRRILIRYLILPQKMLIPAD